MVFISASTGLRQVVFGRPRFRFPFGVQCTAALVMELASLRSTCPMQRQGQDNDNRHCRECYLRHAVLPSLWYARSVMQTEIGQTIVLNVSDG